MKIISRSISLAEITKMAENRFGNLVKAVVDIAKKVMVVDGELHADEEALLLQNNSRQTSLWGINLYPGKYGSEEFIEFDSMINLRPSQNNLSRGVDNKDIQNQIRQIVNQLVTK